MSKWHVIVAFVAIVNVLMIIAFIFSNIYLWDYLETEINERAGNQGQGNFIVPYIQEIDFQISIGHEFWAENGTIVNLGPIPKAVLNYPFILFWVSVVGNLVLIALVLTKKVHEKT
jgi:hypothetical protein